jgi:hypothetical protein
MRIRIERAPGCRVVRSRHSGLFYDLGSPSPGRPGEGRYGVGMNSTAGDHNTNWPSREMCRRARTPIFAPAPQCAYNWPRRSDAMLPRLTLLGLLVRGRPRGSWRSSQYEYALLSDWLPSGYLAPVPSDQAQAHLLNRYLAAFGPASLEDIAWWAGWSKGEARTVSTWQSGGAAERPRPRRRILDPGEQPARTALDAPTDRWCSAITAQPGRLYHGLPRPTAFSRFRAL